MVLSIELNAIFTKSGLIRIFSQIPPHFQGHAEFWLEDVPSLKEPIKKLHHFMKGHLFCIAKSQLK